MIKHQRIFGCTFLAIILLGLAVSCKKDTNTDAPEKSAGKQLLSFKIDSIAGQINESSHTVTIQVPYATDLAHAKPVVTVSEKATVSPVSGAEVNLGSAVTYKVTAEDGSVQSYTVVASKGQNTEAKILEFKVNATAMTGDYYTGKIDEATQTIIVGVPVTRVNRAKLPFTVKLSDGATITPAATDILDFTTAVTFKVKAQSGAEQQYTVKVLNNETRMYFETSLVSELGVDGGYRGSFTQETGRSSAYAADTAGIGTPLYVLFAVLETENVSGMAMQKINLPAGAAISPAADVPQNFTKDVIYTLTTETGEKVQCTVRMLKRKIVLPNEFNFGASFVLETGGKNSSTSFVSASNVTQVWLVNTASNTTYNCTLVSAIRKSQGEGYIQFTVNGSAIPKATPLNLKVKLSDGSEVLTRSRWILN